LKDLPMSDHPPIELVENALIAELKRQNICQDKDVGKTKFKTLLGVDEGIISITHLAKVAIAALNTAPVVSGDASTRKDEDVSVAAGKPSPANDYRMSDGRPIFGEDSPHDIGKHLAEVCQGEIPVNRDLLRAAIYADIDHGITGTIPSGRTKNDLTDSIMGTIAPFLASPEPVSSEERPAQEIPAVEQLARLIARDKRGDDNALDVHGKPIWTHYIEKAKSYLRPAPVKCVSCGGNDADMPCLYPSEGKAGCLRDARLASPVNDKLVEAAYSEGFEAGLKSVSALGLPARWATSKTKQALASLPEHKAINVRDCFNRAYGDTHHPDDASELEDFVRKVFNEAGVKYVD
jgi:hypothetical protein